ncbi:twin-arginine translocase TatA/TatE family subunit [Sphingomonas sp.]|jgi:sec-independent protein translocase protein TatA|uniref:twin-arginine translocase TatA/TatE family subunit n=1 Tax=Sphingomonas sp. TaxID=28214 RepID=UPI002E2F9193|nr:twin-arginine translocase TatA/TatE family subunit [Sphingomonas sp.]HEX4695841.1 twin-arginine translocase TatA/TatE family subunit [Sphingomonas sp.]
MGFGSPIHWIILGVLAILVLGGGRFSNMMGDVAKGIKQFKKGMSEDDEAPASRLESKRADPVIDNERERVRDAER